MDQFDRQILKLVQGDSRMTADVISGKVGLSAAAVQKRVKKLKQTGVIEKEIAVLNGAAVGRNLTIIAEVSLERENLIVLNNFKQQMRQSDQVQQCYYTTGDVDFVVILQLENMEEYEAFTQRYFIDAKNVAKFKTCVVMDRVKVTLDAIS